MKKSNASLLFALGLVLNSFGPARADEVSDTELAVNGFVEACLSVLPDTNKVHALAKILKWEDLPQEGRALMAPAAPELDWQGWFWRDREVLVAVSSGSVNGRDVRTCQTAIRKGVRKLAPETLRKYHPDLIHLEDETAAGQSTSLFKTTLQGEPATIQFAGTVSDDPGMLISLMVFPGSGPIKW